nr:NADH dehydrogenase subunit 5 [Lasioderma serricorne]AWY13620.1 NADH dehydrogenase subunit 5 [Lasioderma serricorne]
MYFLTFLLLSIYTFTLSVNFMIKDYSIIVEYVLMNMNSSNISGIILLDWMSLLFMSFVLFISSMVIFYSEEYMEGDLNLNRFIMLVVMFVLSMMLLIMSPNMISILLGWDGLGLISYCLVVYYQNIKSFNAGMITALSNRVGDVMILISIAWMLNFGSWNFMFYFDFMKDDTSMNMLSWLVIIAAFTKSAQMPFSSWLPAAMAAPTPVSSLVHSSTLVTAGVYLLIRFSSSFNMQMMTMMLFICSMTMFMAGLGANFEFDLKKIIALSTLSQLGLMMSILFLGDYKLAFFHLLTHALFKALLFMCAGNMIHSLLGCQDIRFMGSLINLMPLTCCLFCIANLSLCGIPFLSGFYSKDLILESFCMQSFNMYMYIIFFVSTGLTTSYTIRLLYYLLLGNFNFISLNSLSENSKMMLTGMSGLFTFVIMMGSILSWLIMDIPYLINLPFMMKMSTLMVIIIGSIIGYEISKFSLYYSSKTMNFYKSSMFSSLMWNLPIMSTGIILKLPLILGFIYKKLFDQGWTEFIGSQGIYLMLKKNSSLLQIIHFNHLKIFFMITVMLMFMFIML